MKREHLEDLILRWSTGTLSEEEGRELDAALRADEESRKLFRRQANLDSALREWATEQAQPTPWAVTPASTPARFRGWLVMVAGVIVLLGLALWFRPALRPEAVPLTTTPESTGNGCAVLAQSLDARFAPGATAPASGDTLRPGRLQLTEGFAQIEFFSGASLLVEGAAEIEIISAWEARCLSGKVRVRVPPAARGFRLQTPGVQLIDLGTEFAVNLVPGATSADVHVFDGEVIAQPAGGPEVSLRQGQSLRGAELAALDPRHFLGIGQLEEFIEQRQKKRTDAWWKWSHEVRRDTRLIAYYPMRHFPQWERLVHNAAEPANPARHGGAVGATWTQGRWPQKDALEFKRPGARVRLNLDGTYDALTLACWARIDGIDRKYSALLLTDGYEAGEPHWQIYEDGSLMFSISYPDPARPGKKRNQMYYSLPIFTPANSGRWHHLAVTYDNQSGAVVQYLDGREVSRGIHAFHTPGQPIVFGPCELGNWGLPTEHHAFPLRNLNGSLDEFSIYRAALSAAEIVTLYQKGKPE